MLAPIPAQRLATSDLIMPRERRLSSRLIGGKLEREEEATEAAATLEHRLRRSTSRSCTSSRAREAALLATEEYDWKPDSRPLPRSEKGLESWPPPATE